MKRSLLLAAFLAAGAALLPPPSIARADLKLAGVTNLTKDQIGELVKIIEASAETWLKEDSEDKSLKKMLPNVRYDEGVLDALTTAMKAGRKDPANIYVVNRLLSPIAPAFRNPPDGPWAKPEFCRKLLPLLRGLEPACAKYVDMPKYGKDSLKRFEIPKDLPPGSLADHPTEVMKNLEAINKLRKEKIDKERPLAQHNEEAAHFMGYEYCVMAFANDPKEDDQLIKLVGSLESSGDATFTLVLEAIRREAPRMDAARAKKFYEELAKMADANFNGLPLKLQHKPYRDMTNIPLSAIDNTAPTSATIETGGKMLEAANALAGRANAPAVRVPSQNDVSEAMKLAGVPLSLDKAKKEMAARNAGNTIGDLKKARGGLDKVQEEAKAVASPGAENAAAAKLNEAAAAVDAAIKAMTMQKDKSGKDIPLAPNDFKNALTEIDKAGAAVMTVLNSIEPTLKPAPKAP